MEPYTNTGPISIPSTLDLSGIPGKSVIVTGGASGLGKAYAEAFAHAGAFVTIADFDEAAGRKVVAELGASAQFVKCDVRSWDDQVATFEAAVTKSPSKSIDVVIANAGVVGLDDLYTLQDPAGPPSKPSLRTIDINLTGTIYTTKLALHYFRRQPLTPARDRCLILKGSIASYIDNPGSPQYNIAKWGSRGLMRNLRRTAWRESIRVNLVAPWYVRTPILSQKVQEYLDGEGVGFAEVGDSARGMLFLASDKSVNGRGFAVVPRQWADMGFMDLDHDEYREGDPLKLWQKIALDTVEKLVEEPE